MLGCLQLLFFFKLSFKHLQKNIHTKIGVSSQQISSFLWKTKSEQLMFTSCKVVCKLKLTR